ncbi:inositol monophosphatase family protein [Sinorhizobium fredii]|uniref:inositol monophosphatase family protein n=1 Tax=Rhizobium fredii TaxID=380 RepID=UPI00210C1858|nr:inositol monophosphatase [Sinorhizobium fredii]UTY46690.1 inositol monophosphatase [Sinorhizobium fredii]
MAFDFDAFTEILSEARELVTNIRHSDVMTKSALDFVTDTDFRVDAFLTQKLAALTPGVPIFSEERAMERPQEGAFWIVDPVDGTHNMLADVPHYAISAALFDGREAQIAGVMDVVAQGLYLAEKGSGAQVNGLSLRLSEKASTLFALSSGAIDALFGQADVYRALRKRGKVRNLGSQSLHLCYVAEGRFGLAMSQEARFWDDAPGRLIAEEAGAGYRSFAALERGDFLDVAFSNAPLCSLCAHPDLFDEAARLLSKLWPVNSERTEVQEKQ